MTLTMQTAAKLAGLKPLSEIEDLGMANGWSYFGVPDIIVRCQGLKHRVKEKNVGKCLTEITCFRCGYRYRVDSSD